MWMQDLFLRSWYRSIWKTSWDVSKIIVDKIYGFIESFDIFLLFWLFIDCIFRTISVLNVYFTNSCYRLLFNRLGYLIMICQLMLFFEILTSCQIWWKSCPNRVNKGSTWKTSKHVVIKVTIFLIVNWSKLNLILFLCILCVPKNYRGHF